MKKRPTFCYDRETKKFHESNRKDEALDEFIQGTQLYFNKMLSVSLLYRTERKQYEEFFADLDKEPSSVYGVEHLLRLFGNYSVFFFLPRNIK